MKLYKLKEQTNGMKLYKLNRTSQQGQNGNQRFNGKGIQNNSQVVVSLRYTYMNIISEINWFNFDKIDMPT